MIITGLVILSFLMLHFYDFWIPEIQYKYINQETHNTSKYFHELQEKFHGQTFRTALYCISFVLLGLHLNHGLSSSAQSLGAVKKRDKLIRKVANIYSISIASGFILVALYHYFIY